MNQPMQSLQPFDYTLNVPNPAEAVAAGLQQGVQLAGMMERTDAMAAQRQQTLLENQALQAKAALQTQQQAAVKAFYDLPSDMRTADEYERISAALPKDQAENVRASFEMKTKEQQRQELLFGGQVFAALRSGDRETANSMLTKKAEAARNAGDETQAKAYENAAEMAAIAPDQAELFIGATLAALPGGKDFITSVGAQQDQRRERMLEDSTNLKAYSDAKISEAKAMFAELREKLEVDKLKPKPMGAGGPAKPALSVKDSLNAEGKIRDDFTRDYKPIAEQTFSIQRLRAAEDTAAGDLALIFNYMKMLDPGSAVKEGEFANAQNATGIPDVIRNQWNKIQTGERLNPGQRASFKGQAEKLYEPYKKQGDRIKTAYTSEAKRIGLEPSSIFLSAPQDDEPKAAAQPGPVMTPAAPTSTQAAPTTSGGGWSIVNVSKGK